MSLPATRRIARYLLFVGLAAPFPAFAGEPVTPPPTEMETVTVTGQSEDQLTGSNTLDRGILDRLPGRNGSLNEALGILPGVQLSDESRTSDNAGEILPPNLSISGGRFYENNFIIDGLGNNSLLDPVFSDPSNNSNVPGHPQELFVQPVFVEEATVYRSNIPARFSGFTGGVVDVVTRDPADTFGGQLYLRHTRDEWTELHYPDSRKAEFETPQDGSAQPEFEKYDEGASLDIPLGDQSGILVGYSKSFSDIPMVLIDQTETQTRTLENYFLKYVNQLTPSSTLRITGIATPYEADYFLDETVKSNYTIENGGYGLVTSLEQRFNWGTVAADLGYRASRNNREAPPNYFTWQVTASKPWGAVADAGQKFPYSREGGYGDIEKEQSTYSGALNISLEPFMSGTVRHEVAAGVGVENAEGSFKRLDDMTVYTLASKSTKVVCAEGAIDCIPKEQFLYTKNVYPADNAEETIRYYDAYLEDKLEWGRLTLRPGVHFSSDDLQRNDNWAPRLAASLDLFGNGSTLLVGGVNRYYGRALLTHALAEEKLPYQNWRRGNSPTDTKSTVLNPDNTPKPWQNIGRKSVALTRLTDLDTPYSDEWTLGIEQQLGGGKLNLDYLEREGEDELATRALPISADGYIYSEWSNDGRSDHREATLSWERGWANHALLLTAGWQETETSNGDYTERVDADNDGLQDPVWYHGRIVDRQELPSPDFNREWVAALTYTGRLPWGFTFTNVTRYRSGHRSLEDTGETKTLDNGEELDVYDEVKQPESWVFDWRVDWEKKVWNEHLLIVSLEINNVFDEKVESGEVIDIYDLGRQIWLGMTYKF